MAAMSRVKSSLLALVSYTLSCEIEWHSGRGLETSFGDMQPNIKYFFHEKSFLLCNPNMFVHVGAI